jgi:hypothetical protein
MATTILLSMLAGAYLTIAFSLGVIWWHVRKWHAPQDQER